MSTDSETAAVNNILNAFGKPSLRGSLAENVRRMRTNPAGYGDEVSQRITEKLLADSAQTAPLPDAQQLVGEGYQDFIAKGREARDKMLREI